MNNIIIYNTEDGKAKINLLLDDGSVWLSQSEKQNYFKRQNKILASILNLYFKIWNCLKKKLSTIS